MLFLEMPSPHDAAQVESQSEGVKSSGIGDGLCHADRRC